MYVINRSVLGGWELGASGGSRLPSPPDTHASHASWSREDGVAERTRSVNAERHNLHKGYLPWLDRSDASLRVPADADVPVTP